MLLQQILRAHQIFLLHQAQSIAELFVRVPRPKFCGFLKRFWDDFIWSWDVLLHGNPGVDIFNGLKLAAGGELGIGVGEEEWGSGEREVLEGFVGRTEGLVDLIVSRFGDAPGSSEAVSTSSLPRSSSRDINRDRQVAKDYPRPADGAVFSGIGALTRPSVRNISSWMEWLHIHGQDAYGVRDNPSSTSRRKRRKIQPLKPDQHRPGLPNDKQQIASRVSPTQRVGSHTGHDGSAVGPSIPPPIVASNKPAPVSSANSASRSDLSPSNHVRAEGDPNLDDTGPSTDTLMKYLTLGVYGSTWGIPSGRPPVDRRGSSLRREEIGKSPTPGSGTDKLGPPGDPDTSGGCFLIGFQGELENDGHKEMAGPDAEPTTDLDITASNGDLNGRVSMRILHVERANQKDPRPSKNSDSDPEAAAEVYFDRLRVVVYVQEPFMFTFLFELQTDALAMPSFYRSLHHQLGPLQRPLLASTSPSKVSDRLWEAAAPKSTASKPSTQPICDLVYDPVRLTVHTTIPNIPEPGPATNEQAQALPWTRLEALSVHSQIMNTYASTRRKISELERTCKTSRGWWVVWMRLPHAPHKPNTDIDPDCFREAFLIRKASDYVSPAARKSSGGFGRDVSGSSASGAWGAGKLAEGIGIDARQYIEGLLSLNR